MIENKTIEDPFEIIFINKEGQTDIIKKSQLGKPINIDDEVIIPNNHYDVLYYNILKNKLKNKKELEDLRKKNNIITYTKTLLENNYIIINNFTYYGILKSDTLDVLIVTDEKITTEQLTAIEDLKNTLNKGNTRIILSEINIKTKQTSERKIETYDQLLKKLAEKKIGKIK